MTGVPICGRVVAFGPKSSTQAACQSAMLCMMSAVALSILRNVARSNSSN